MMETLGIGSVVGWSICVGVAIGMLLSEFLHGLDKHTEADDVLEEPAVPDRPVGDDGVRRLSPGDPIISSAEPFILHSAQEKEG